MPEGGEHLMMPSEPLRGLSIVVTRAESQGMEFAAMLGKLGAKVAMLPMIGIGPPADCGPLNRAIESIGDYDWIFFTSFNAVQAVLPEVKTQPRASVGVVGKSTRTCIEALGWRVDLVPADFSAEGLCAVLARHNLRGQRILIPSGDLARDALPQRLRERGATVDVVQAYRNQIPPGAEVHAKQLFLNSPPPDWVTFASPSAVDNLLSVLDASALCSVRIASIGPTTSAAVRAHDLSVAVQASEHTVPGLVAAIVDSVIT